MGGRIPQSVNNLEFELRESALESFDREASQPALY